jgi:hypothetical protein
MMLKLLADFHILVQYVLMARERGQNYQLYGALSDSCVGVSN